MKRREGAHLFAGLLLIVFILFGQSVYGAVTAGARLDPVLRGASGLSTVIVVLDFTPERFHSERLASFGVFAGRDGAVNRVWLRNVTPEDLGRLSRLAWVSRIEPGTARR